MLTVPVRLPDQDHEACPCCGGRSPLFGVVDFNKSCEDRPLPLLPPSGAPVYYNRCETCDYVFTRAFDHWNAATFARYVYNADYGVVDPEFFQARPNRLVGDLTKLFGAYRDTISILDWGGGNGVVAARLVELGFDAVSYDPFFGDSPTLPDRQFDLLIAVEVIEHMVDPLNLPQQAAKLLKPDGVVLLSTCVQPADFTVQRMNWWYLAPRNGHVGGHSEKSLHLIWRRCGFNLGSSDDKTLHLAYRTLPDFAAPLIRS